MPQRARIALIGAGGLLVLLLATWVAAFHVAFFEHLDQSILRGFAGLGSKPRVQPIANWIATLCDPNPYVYFCAVPVAVALARRRLWVALAIIAILIGANFSTQLLKPLLAVQRPFSLPGTDTPPLSASWPSGHATAAMSLALCCMLAAPARLRPFVTALGAAFAVAVCYSFLALEWHYPSDVLGGFLIAGIWTLLALAAIITAIEREVPGAALRAPQQRLSVREALGPPSFALLGAAGLAALVLIARPHAVVSYARVHEAFVIGAVAIGALGLALVTGVMLALRR
jgi:membrane-associated phospholipid phosphatase